MDGDPPKNIYSFSGGKNHREIRRTRQLPTSREVVFSKYVAKGIDPITAYLRAFPTKNRQYAKYSANTLLKQERITKMVSKEIGVALKNVGVDKEYLLSKAKDVIDDPESKNSDRIRAIELLMKIDDMFPSTQKSSESLTIFQGFTPERLKEITGQEVRTISSGDKKAQS